MSSLPQLRLLDTARGDVVLEQQQAACIGAAFGNGAANFASPANVGVIPMGDSGNLAVITQQPGTNPAVINSDIVMAVFTLPPGGIDINGRMLEMTANGATAANNDTKTMKLIVGATNPVVGQPVNGGITIASAVANSAPAGLGWSLSAEISKYGSKGSNTQQALHTAAQTGSVVGALQAPSGLNLIEAGPIPIVVTCNAATTIADVTFNSLQVSGWN